MRGGRRLRLPLDEVEGEGDGVVGLGCVLRCPPSEAPLTGHAGAAREAMDEVEKEQRSEHRRRRTAKEKAGGGALDSSRRDARLSATH